MQIIKYELNSKNKYNVYLSTGEVMTLDERVITENELLIKKEIDDSLYDKLISDNSIYDAIDMSIRYIAIRFRSIKELKDYLKRKNINLDIIDIVIEKLIKLNYLDDNRFTKAFIKDKLSFTNMGDYKIKEELIRFGVPKNIIDNNISEIDENTINNKLVKLIDKYLLTNKKYTGTILKNKLYNYLVNKGYSKSKVIHILNNYDF